MSKGRLWLSVPYEEKDHAKQLGARWNPTVRRWWISPADLQRVEASNDSWLMGGGYTIYVTGKLYLNVVDCPCPACREDVMVASLLATGAFEIVEIDDEDSEPCSPMSPAASTEGADADPVYLSHVGVVSDQALRAKIDFVRLFGRTDTASTATTVKRVAMSSTRTTIFLEGNAPLRLRLTRCVYPRKMVP
jgi:hypothetical protein